MVSPKGIAPLFIVLIVAALAALAGGGYYLYRSAALPVPGATPLVMRATEADFAFIQDATLRKHFVAQANLTRYRTKTYSDGADMTFVTEVEFQGEDFNTRDIEYRSTNQETRHKLVIGDTTYVKDFSDNAWWKQTAKLDVTPTLSDQPGESEPIDFKAEYSKPDLQFKALGQEACGNLTCYKYQQLTGGPEGMAFIRYFWFDARDFLLRRDETTVGEFKNTTDYSYDNINLTLPSPAKDVPTGKDIFDYYFL